MSLRQDTDSGANIPVANVSKFNQVSIVSQTQGPGSSVASTPVTGLQEYRTASIFASLNGTAASTIDVYLQTSPDGGTTWVDYVHFPQLAAGASAYSKAFSVSTHTQSAAIATVGTGTSPALPANTILGGNFGDRIRSLVVGGASTASGATQTISVSFGS